MDSTAARWRVVVPIKDETAWETALAELGELGVEAVIELGDWAEAYFARQEDAVEAARVLGLDAPVRGDAGSAEVFGAVLHPTTELCLELMAGVVRPEDRVVDVGSGSGRLSLEAMRLGARCVAVDPDWPAAVACRAAGIDVVQASVNALRSGACDGVLANLHLALWRDVAGEIRRVARKGAWVVASGFLDEQEAEARSLVTRVDRIVRRDGWLGLAGTL